jgi:hypothetical protein
MPTIVFEVNLEVDRQSVNVPVATSAEADNLRTTRSTWFPDIQNDNRQLKHGDQFTVTGKRAMHLKNNFTTGDDALLKVISQTE